MLRSAGRHQLDFCGDLGVGELRRAANVGRLAAANSNCAHREYTEPAALQTAIMKKARKAPASSFDASPPRSSSAPGARSTAPAASTTSTDGVQAFASVAAFAFEPEMDGELPLQKGEQVYVFPEIVTSPGWWLAAVDGQPAPGLVPCEFLRPLSAYRPEGAPPPPEVPEMAKGATLWARVLYQFDAELDAELSASAGQIVQMHAPAVAPTGWAYVQRYAMEPGAGLVPLSFLLPLPPQQQLAADEQLARLRDEYGGGGGSFSWRWLVLVLGAGLAVFAVVVSTLLPASYLR